MSLSFFLFVLQFMENEDRYINEPHTGLTVDSLQLTFLPSSKPGKISKIQPDQIYILCPSLRIRGQLPCPIVNGGRDSVWKWKDFQLWRARDLDLGSGHILHTIVHHSSTSTYMPNFIGIKETFCRWTNVRTHRRTDIWDPLYENLHSPCVVERTKKGQQETSTIQKYNVTEPNNYATNSMRKCWTTELAK